MRWRAIWATAIGLAVMGAVPAMAQTPGSKPSTVTFPVEEDHFFDVDGAKLHAKFFAPAKTGKYPAIVYVTGGGNYSLMVDAYARNTAKAFTDAGVAVFMFDKRGQGKSTGSFPAAELDMRAADSIAAFDAMAKLPQVDADRLGIWAISQAGHFIAPVMTARPNADFLILISPAAEPPFEHFQTITRYQLKKAGLNGADLQSAEALWTKIMRYFGSADGYEDVRAALADAQGKAWHPIARKVEYWADLPATPADLKTPDQVRSDWAAKPQEYDWLRAPAHHRDYAPDYASIKQPVLLVFGDADTLIDPGEAASIFAKAWTGRRDTTIVTFSGAGHGIQRRGDAENPMREYLDVATLWSKRHFNTSSVPSGASVTQ